MTKIRAHLLCLCGALVFAGRNAATAAEPCTTEFRLPIALRFATAAATTPAIPVAAYLVGDLTPGLRIVDARSGRLLWTAGPTGAYTQRFAGMTAGFSSSLAAIDTDGDGAHDRIYAGDLQGRLWRFDIDARGPGSGWAAGGVFADLANAAAGRGFLAAPDLSLIAPPGAEPWLSIALGTANTAPGPALPGTTGGQNRFFVLRDRAPFARWTQGQYDRWSPLLESDLLRAEGTRLNAVRTDGAGFYINLGIQQVVASALTIDGETFYTVAATSVSLLPGCNATRTSPLLTTVNVGTISAVDGAASPNGSLMEPIPSASATSAVTLVRDESTPGEFVCTVAGQALPGCALDTTLHRSFWRREDAD